MSRTVLDILPTSLDYSALPAEELKERISSRKRELNAVILGHNYQRGEIQDVSDYLGDSLGLSQEAADTDADMIVALPEADWDDGAHCGKTISITHSTNGKTHSATVADMCPGCGSGSLDMSPALFTALNGGLTSGTFPESWSYA